jgi:hypothetical protein
MPHTARPTRPAARRAGRLTDLFDDEAAIEADLRLQEILLWSRAALPDRLAAASLSQRGPLVETLRIESMYQVCEFFYLLRARAIVDADDIAGLADIHNRHIADLVEDPAKMKRLGLRRDRLLGAIFTGDTLPRLVETWRERPGWIDQSNLARFLATVMSTETCRKLVVAGAEAGFFSRARPAHGAVLICSTGVMEEVFGSLLRETRLAIAAASRAAASPPEPAGDRRADSAKPSTRETAP